MCSSEDPAAADESSTTQESPIAVRGFQPQCHLPRPAAPAGVTHAVQGAGSTGELRELLSYLQCASCWFALTDTAYLENVLFVRGGEYFISWQHSEFHLTMVHVILQRIWSSSTLFIASSHSQLFEFSLLRLHSLGQKYILGVPRQIPSKSTNQKFPVSWKGKGEFLEKLYPASIPVFVKKETGKTRYKATVEVSSVEEHFFQPVII